MLYLFSKYGILTQIIKYTCSDRFGAIVSQNNLKNALHCVLRRKAELTQFYVRWMISRKRGYSENVRKYYTIGFFLYVLYYMYVLKIYNSYRHHRILLSWHRKCMLMRSLNRNRNPCTSQEHIHRVL